MSIDKNHTIEDDKPTKTIGDAKENMEREIEKGAGRSFCQLFPGLIEFLKLLLKGLFFVIQFHKAGNIGVNLLLREKRIDLAVACGCGPVLPFVPSSPA